MGFFLGLDNYYGEGYVVNSNCCYCTCITHRLELIYNSFGGSLNCYYHNRCTESDLPTVVSTQCVKYNIAADSIIML